MDIKQLQKTVIDALEDVKAQDIRLFDTTHLTSMFDRIVIASGTSNRQTRALAASVRDKVKQAGGSIVSIEGENTGEWVLVDLGDMVVHIMQPTIRAYYQLEEIWGDKPLSLKEPKRPASKKTASTAAAKKPAARKTASKTAATKKTTTKAAKTPAKKTAASKTAASKKAAAPSRAPKETAVKKTTAKKTTASKTVKTAATKTATTKTVAAKTAAKKTSTAKKRAK